MSYISVNNVEKSLGKKKVLKGISFEIGRGDFLGIIGPSGSGKTTLLRLLVKFFDPERGEILLNNKPLKKEHIGYATQENSFYFDLTVMENLMYFGRMNGLSKEETLKKSNKLLELVELTGNEKLLAAKLSGGMKRRLDLAISLLADPRILVLDEITTGLDPGLKKHILDIIKTINKKGVTTIYATHLLDEVEEYCNKVILLSDGHIIDSTTPKKLKSEIKDFDIIKVKSETKEYEPILKSLEKYDHRTQYHTADEQFLYIYTSDSARDVQNLAHIFMTKKEELVSIDIEKPSLQKIFDILKKNSICTPKEYQKMKNEANRNN